MRHDYRTVAGNPEGQEHLEDLELAEVQLQNGFASYVMCKYGPH